MKAVIQRVSQAEVTVSKESVGKISRGLLVFLGIERGDGPEDLAYIVNKVINARIFTDDAGKMNLSVSDINGELLVISQFTICADVRKGNRPSFNAAAPPETAVPLYRECIKEMRKFCHVETGKFGAVMKIKSTNEGPVTIIYESRK